MVHTQEHRQFTRVLQSLCKQQAGDLGHRLDDQDAGHNRRAGKMALEKLLVDADVFDPLDSRVSFDLNDLVHQEEGVPVRQNLGDLPDVQKGVGAKPGHPLGLLGGLVQLLRKLLI